MVLLLVVAGLAEGIGFASLPVILSILDGGLEAGGQPDRVSELATRLVESVGMRPTLGPMLSLVALGAIVRSGLTLLAAKQAGEASAAFAAALRRDLVDALLQAEWAHFVEQPLGMLTNSAGAETNRASAVYLDLANLLSSLLSIAIFVVLAMLVSPGAAVVAAGGGMAMAFMLRRFIRMGRQAGMDYTVHLRTLTERLVEALSGIKGIRAMAREPGFRRLLNAEVEGINDAQRREVLSGALLTSLQEPITLTVLAVAAYAGARSGRIELDALLFLGVLFQRILSRAGLLQRQYQLIRVRESAFWAVMDTIDRAAQAAEATVESPAVVVTSERPSISLERVTFGYDDTPVLEGFDATFGPGEFVAVVGPSGSGKTTIVDLVLGLQQPWEGVVAVDGHSLADLDLRSWRRKIGYVPQETVLFRDSIRANVLLAEVPREGDDARVARALRRAGAWSFVEGLPDGIRHLVGERGARLSGGQRQRISIARALVNEPSVLVLDEATTGLDLETEREVLASLAGMEDRPTIIAVSHQPEVLRHATRVIDLSRTP